MLILGVSVFEFKCPESLEKGFGVPGNTVTRQCELPRGVLGTELRLLQERHLLLTLSHLSSPKKHFLKIRLARKLFRILGGNYQKHMLLTTTLYDTIFFQDLLSIIL